MFDLIESNAFLEEKKIKPQAIKTAIKKNKEDYYNIRTDILSKHKGKYIAFSNGKISGCSTDLSEMLQYIEDDPTTYTALVGEEEKTKPEVVFQIDDLISTDSEKTCFPYHHLEQQVVDSKINLDHSGWCGGGRMFVSVLLQQNNSDDKGIVGTFLVDTGSPQTYVQKKLLDKIAIPVSHVVYTHVVYILGIKQYVVGIDKAIFGGILGMDFIIKSGLCVQSCKNQPEIVIEM